MSDRVVAPAATPSDKSWGPVGAGCFALAAGALGATGLLGPSAAEPPLGRGDDGATPPFHLAGHPSAWLVTLLLAIAVAAGVVTIALLLTRRWRPRPRRLAAAGIGVVAALALLPPLGSADPLSYAAYGRMAATGHDPYATTPAQLAPHDPVAAAVEPPWQHEPSVYGPLATGEQALAASVGGKDMAQIVLVLDLVGAAIFVVTGWLLVATASHDDAARRRAALWIANPLLWLQLVAGAHLDVAVAALALAALSLGRKHPVLGAAVAGIAGIVKPPGGLVWLGIAWPARRHPRRLALLVAATAVVVVPAYVVAGGDAWQQLGRAGRRISRATPWRVLLDHADVPRGLVLALAAVAVVALVPTLLSRHERTSGGSIALAVTTGYVLAAAYALPWYDALPWALLAAVTVSWLDWFVLAHTAVLSLAYLPGRDISLPSPIAGITTVMRNDVAPALLALLIVAAFGVSWSMSRSAGFDARPPRP